MFLRVAFANAQKGPLGPEDISHTYLLESLPSREEDSTPSHVPGLFQRSVDPLFFVSRLLMAYLSLSFSCPPLSNRRADWKHSKCHLAGAFIPRRASLGF